MLATLNGEYFRHGLILGVLVGLLAAHVSAPPPGADSPPAAATGDAATHSGIL